MAMNKNTLGSALWTAVKATTVFTPSISVVDDAKGLQVWTTVADQIIQHIISSAEIKVDTFAVTVSGVSTGSGSTSSVAGNVTGKVTS